MPSQPRRERRRPSSREALLEAAVSEFTEKGYEGATIAGIAARAGVSAGAVRTHFRSKLALLLEAVGLSTIEAFARRSAHIAALPPSEVGPALARGLLGRPSGRRDLLLVDAISLARRDPRVAEGFRRLIEKHVEAFARTSQPGIDSGRIEPIVPTGELGRLMLALSFGIMALRALEESPPADATVARLVELLLQPAHEREKSERALARVEARARAAEQAEANLKTLIAVAAADGHSLRRIGKAAGLSHERVRRILAERPAAADE